MMQADLTGRDTPPPRPLHVEPKGEARILLDGPALCIERAGRRATSIPLRRISRIHLPVNVDITSDAILACAERGIVLVIHDLQEFPVARIIGRASERTQLHQRLFDLTDRPDWRDRYRDWRRSMEQRICAILRKRLEAPWRLRNRPDEMRTWIQRRATIAAGPRDADRTRRIFRQLSLAWMQTRLLAHGIDAENEIWLAGPPDLPRDLGELLADRLETLRLGWLEGRAAAARRKGEAVHSIPRQAIVAKFEKRQARVERLGDDIINRLHRWLVEME